MADTGRHAAATRRSALALVIAACALAVITWPAAPAKAEVAREVADPIYGMTHDDIGAADKIAAASRNLARFPTSRIVFDEWMPATYYRTGVRTIRPHSYVMGELLDSYYVKDYSVRAYHRRADEYMRTLGTDVDIWEVGNEVNGEWLGRRTDVVRKIAGAYDRAERRGYRTSMTLYYNPDCWAQRSNEMFRWSGANVPPRMKRGLDYVLVSYYEQDCNGKRLTQAQWQRVFNRLHVMFPNSKLGFGEVGADQQLSLAARQAYMRRYYGLDITTPGYIGGYFWWYGTQDLTPWSRRPLWRTFNAVIQRY